MAKYPTFDQILAMPLPQQALAMEEYRNRARLAELKAMEPALRLLEVQRAAIKAAGYTIYPESISRVLGEKLTLRISGSAFDGDVRLVKALRAAGFEIAERNDLGSSSYVTLRLKKGRLHIQVTLSSADLNRVFFAPASPAVSAPCEHKEAA